MLAVGSTKMVENERETERENISCQFLLFYNVFSEQVFSNVNQNVPA